MRKETEGQDCHALLTFMGRRANIISSKKEGQMVKRDKDPLEQIHVARASEGHRVRVPRQMLQLEERKREI